jgi:hypothetical protein
MKTTEKNYTKNFIKELKKYVNGYNYDNVVIEEYMGLCLNKKEQNSNRNYNINFNKKLNSNKKIVKLK